MDNKLYDIDDVTCTEIFDAIDECLCCIKKNPNFLTDEEVVHLLAEIEEFYKKVSSYSAEQNIPLRNLKIKNYYAEAFTMKSTASPTVVSSAT